MKTAMACSLALGLAAATIGAGADGLDCCKGPGARAAAGCPAGDCKICLDTNGMTVAEMARRLSEEIGVEVRVQGPSFETLKLKLCAPTPEVALTLIARPRPVPPYLRLVEASACWNASKMMRCLSAGMPIPVSDTSNATTDGAALRLRLSGLQPSMAGRLVTFTFQGAAASSAAFLTAAQAGGVLIADRPLTGKVTFHGKGVPVSMLLDAIAVASGQPWKPGYLLQLGPETLVTGRGARPMGGAKGILRTRPGSTPTHLHPSPTGTQGIAPAPGSIVRDPAGEVERLEKEAFRRQQLGEWAGVFTQESPRETRRAIRDLRIRVETTIQKLESYPPQNRHLGFAMWRARYERMLEDYKHLAPEQQKQVQPVLDVMKYFAAPSN